MKKALFLFLYVSAPFLVCCSSGKKGSAAIEDFGRKEDISYAKGFEITHCKDYTIVSIADPWDTTKFLQEYILVEKGKPLPENLPAGTVVKTPVENVVMYTTIHASIWEELESLQSISGICEPEYLTSKKALNLVQEGKIADCGKASSPNVEKIMDIGGEVIIASPFEHGGYGQAEKLGIPIFESADYMETHPLGRVEWLKVFGLLCGKRDLADSLFNSTVQRYLHYKEIARSASSRPKVMCERKYGSSWFIPGGASYIAQMYSDAGADYIFADDPETGSVPVAFETVYDKGINSDIWLLKYAMPRPMTYEDLKMEYEPYSSFAPFKNRTIFSCNTVDTPYYEYIAIHPDYILAELVHIFHKELLPDYVTVCFKAMAE